jgi:diguanylate cyclase (GGDEF)-like protein
VQVLSVAARVELFAGILNKWIELQDVMSFNAEQFDQEKQELTVCYYADISKKVKTEKQLIQLESTLTHKMSHDSVTGMLNHHSMFQTLSAEVSRSRRYNNPLSLVLMNVDYQSDQESLAQERVEQIRLMISQLLKDQMRWADIVGHLQNYDFVLLLPETVYESAEILIKKLNKSMQDASMDVAHINYGLSQWQKGDDVQMFLARAAKDLKEVVSLES